MRLSVFEVEDWERAAFSPFEDAHRVRFTEEPLRADSVEEHADAEIVSPFIHSKLGGEVLDRLPGLRMIATRSTGVDHIDLDACADRGVTVANVPGYGGVTVAEHTFALLLAVARNVVQAADRTRRGDFSQRGLTGVQIRGRTLAVIGAGAIGREVARIGRGMGMDVVAFDVKRDEDAAREIGFRYVDLDDAVSWADVVTVHVPGGPDTHHLIGAEEIGRMRDGAILLNTSRGSVVDARALAQALVEGRLAGAGLDVVEEEPAIREEAELMRSGFERRHDLEALIADHVLLRLSNVVLTPHIGFATRQAVEEILEATCRNIHAFLERGEPENVVAGGGLGESDRRVP